MQFRILDDNIGAFLLSFPLFFYMTGRKNTGMAGRENVQKILTAVDGLTKKIYDIEHAFVSNMAAHNRFEERIGRIEKYLKLNLISS